MNEKEKEAIIRDYQRNKILDELVGLRKEYKNYLVEISKDGDIKRYGIRIKKYREIIATLRERDGISFSFNDTSITIFIDGKYNGIIWID